MMRATMGLHPSFDELSAHADRPDTDAARTRVGRHVAGCGACAETLREIRALGDAARAAALGGAPTELWARIESRLDDSIELASGTPVEREVSVGSARDAAEDHTPPVRRTPSSMRRTVLGVIALAVTAGGFVALDSREPLAAATPRRLWAERDAARPGVPVTLHYRPIPALASLPTLTVWALVPRANVRQFDQALERAGTIRRVSALEYTGAVVMPDSTPVALLVVGDSSGDTVDRTEAGAGRFPLALFAADSSGRPRLDALVRAVGTSSGSVDRSTQQRLVALMQKLYPRAPETWILSAAYAPRTMIGDIVKLFESKERQYYGWHDRLEHRAGLSADVEIMMANIGWELMDTARADFWTSRLLHEHPTSASLPGVWIQRYRDVPNDSAAAVLREFEPIYQRAGAPRDAMTRAITMAERSGDSALARLWHLRADPAEISPVLAGDLSQLAGDPAGLAEARRRLLIALAHADSGMRGGPTLWGGSRYAAWYLRQRVRTRLAALTMLGGDARTARDTLDRIVGEFSARPTCPMPETVRWRGEASRRLGQLEDARADFAYVVVTSDWRMQALSDSMPSLLGAAYTRKAWEGALVSAQALKDKCWADAREARRRDGG